MFSRVRRIALAGALSLVATGFAVTNHAPAQGATTWAPAATAAITPGVQTNTEGSGQCTANFVFTDAAGNVYLGQAAHCSGTGAATDTNGCTAGTLPLGTAVTFNRGGSLLSSGTQVGSGTLAYSSWNTMQARGEKDANTCAYNDFALVKVNPADVAKVNPSIPFWGGPVGINTTGTSAGDRVYSYGNSGLRFGVEQLSPKTGTSLGQDPADGGWTHPLYTVTPGVPGDSGSAFLDASGRAVGTLSTLGLAPLPASNNIGDLSHELAYAQAHSGIAGLQLVLGTEPFDPSL
ncbi:trypsin-like peptidase domain-containing protein [Nocardioides antri]|uniref:Trypsin-like peptidase domain-containing protein n=1 Tax=Nocardioides antri TaxID=2607659 RepID=A0A5B1MA98_9ACTN|nr:trypsin-like peptidase domain-containing protein [Nocardioides antri]KAA1429386.1 trypsin-like peptidase domain-containing protein [Nocardioides antri]